MPRQGGRIAFVLIAILVAAIVGGWLSLVFSRFVVGSGAPSAHTPGETTTGMSHSASPDTGASPGSGSSSP
jgi:hypothetical protein